MKKSESIRKLVHAGGNRDGTLGTGRIQAMREDRSCKKLQSKFTGCRIPGYVNGNREKNRELISSYYFIIEV